MAPPPQPGPTPAATLARSIPAGRFILLWAAGWALVGCAVAAGFGFVTSIDPWPALRLSILFAEVVGFTALVSARLIFPLFVRLPTAVSLLLQVLTLLGGTVFGSITVALFAPLFSLAQIRTVALIVLINAAIAVIVGLALYTYDTMRRQIENSFEALRRKEALERELSIAREVQQQLLPLSTPTVQGLELTGVCIPAIGVGGDYFDFLQLSDRLVGLVVADISGKGIPAALLMAGLQAAVRSLTRPEVAPAELNRRLNEILYHSSAASRYATMFLGFYDAETRSLNYSNAGHHPPLLLSNGSVTQLDAGGMPIGMFLDTGYRESSHRLSPGDLLILFTDGVIEQPNAQGDEFGEERLIELLKSRHEQAVEQIVGDILEALNGWSGGAEAHDDVTLVLARVR